MPIFKERSVAIKGVFLMKSTKILFPYRWNLIDGFPAKSIPHHGAKVFSCFSGGGGSSMGYKLAGYDVIGFNEIDKRQAECYLANMGGNILAYIEDIRTFRKRKDLPPELFKLDILDGSPPCSSFSMNGKRENTWGKEKQFREGQIKQVLDELPFEWVKLAQKLQSKIVVMENVKGLTLGGATVYLGKIITMLKDAGYCVTSRLLNSKVMGVPQSRERLFIFGIRKDLISNIETHGIFETEPFLTLKFKEVQIPFSEIDEGITVSRKTLNKDKKDYNFWCKAKQGQRFAIFPKGFNASVRLNLNIVLPTIISNNRLYHPDIPAYLTISEIKLGGSFPLDYNTLGQKIGYIVGMSVPPVMIAQIAWRIKEQ